jgi:hypothetical protein
MTPRIPRTWHPSSFRRVSITRAWWAAFRSWVWWHAPVRHGALEMRIDQMGSPESIQAQIDTLNDRISALSAAIQVSLESAAVVGGGRQAAAAYVAAAAAQARRREMHVIPGGAR